MIELAVPGSAAALTLDPACGATVQSLVLEAQGRPVSVLCADPGALPPARDTPPSATGPCFHPFFSGRFLWPFNDRIPYGRYTFEGQAYVLPANDPTTGDAIHGMLYARPVSVAPDAADRPRSVTVSDTIGCEEYAGYPFDVAVRIELNLARSSLELAMTSENVGTRACPVAFGWHPYFVLQDAKGADDVVLRTNAERYVPVDERLLPTGGTAAVRGTALERFCGSGGDRIDGEELDVAITSLHAPITTELQSDRFLLRVEQGGAFAYQQWFVPPDRGSIAIEPVTAATDSFNRPELGLGLLAPGESVRGVVRVSLSG